MVTVLVLILGLIIFLVLVVLVYIFKTQRTLVNLDELCKNAMSQIGVQQSSRWDALTALAELTKSYNEHEYNTLRDVIAQRAVINSGSSASDADAQENMITQALGRIIAVAEQYPELKANENYSKTMDSVNLYENQVRMSRRVYNDTVTIFNREVRQFPTNLVAKTLGFVEKEYLKVEAAKTDMPSMKIS
jgi:LemA protein